MASIAHSTGNGAHRPRVVNGNGRPGSLVEETGLESDDLTEITQTKMLVDQQNSQTAHDASIYRIAVFCLGGTTLFTVVSLSVLSGIGASIPDGLIALGSGAVGALAGLLTPISVRR